MGISYSHSQFSACVCVCVCVCMFGWGVSFGKGKPLKFTFPGFSRSWLPMPYSLHPKKPSVVLTQPLGSSLCSVWGGVAGRGRAVEWRGGGGRLSREGPGAVGGQLFPLVLLNVGISLALHTLAAANFMPEL